VAVRSTQDAEAWSVITDLVDADFEIDSPGEVDSGRSGRVGNSAARKLLDRANDGPSRPRSSTGGDTSQGIR